MGENITINQYQLLEKIGEGALGLVFACFDTSKMVVAEQQQQQQHPLHHHQRLAVKIMSKSVLKREKDFTRVGRKMIVHTALDDVQREIAIMKKLDHPNVIRFVEAVDDAVSDKLFIVMEICEGGRVMNWNPSMKRYLAHPNFASRTNPNVLSPEARLSVMRDVVSGLHYLHSQGIVHRDLKPENLLLTHTGQCKIIDYGLSQIFETLERNEDPEGKLVKLRGTFYFQPPECLTGEEFDGFSVDVWALGVTMYAFMFSSIPFYSDSPIELFQMISKEEIPWPVEREEIEEKEEEQDKGKEGREARNLCRVLLEKDPTKRPKNAKVLLRSCEECRRYLARAPATPSSSAASIAGDNVDIITVSETEIREALTVAKLDVASIAKLKLFAVKWRSRASSRLSGRLSGSAAGGGIVAAASSHHQKNSGADGSSSSFSSSSEGVVTVILSSSDTAESSAPVASAAAVVVVHPPAPQVHHHPITLPSLPSSSLVYAGASDSFKKSLQGTEADPGTRPLERGGGGSGKRAAEGDTDERNEERALVAIVDDVTAAAAAESGPARNKKRRKQSTSGRSRLGLALRCSIM